MPVLIFDFFGVVCSEIAPFVLPKYMSEAEAVEFKRTTVLDTDLGLITQDEMFDVLAKFAHVPAATLVAEFWSYAAINRETVALIEDLKKTYRVALLSNAIIPFIRQLMARDNLERLFDPILISADVHLAKPDPAFFQLMIDKLGVAAEECIFLDDNMPNIRAAESLGMKGILFTTPAAARAELKARFGVE
jgi:epoxide hydrolase-like predicted phosphatase